MSLTPPRFPLPGPSRGPFARDLVELGAELRQTASRLGEPSRRHFLAGIAAAGLAPLLLARPARADADEITFAAWGDSDINDLTQAFGKPFKRDTGIDVVFDGSGPTEGKIKAMVDSGQIDWDICDVDGYAAMRLGKEGELSAIDYGVVDRSRIMTPFAFDYGVGGYTYSFVLAYNASVYKDNPPQSWADFWNTRKFPGKRGLWKWMIGGFEASAMAHGAKRDAIYPLDVAECVTRISQLKPHLVAWESGAQASQMLRDKVVTMACIWHTRAAQLGAETKGQIAWSFNDGILCPGVWAVPKNNPAGGTVFKLLNYMLDPGRQIAFSAERHVGPANPVATHAMPASLHMTDPTQSEALAQQVIIDSGWWAENYDKAMAKYQQMLTQA